MESATEGVALDLGGADFGGTGRVVDGVLDLAKGRAPAGCVEGGGFD